MQRGGWAFWETARVGGARGPGGVHYTVSIQPSGVHRPWPNGWDGLLWLVTAGHRLLRGRHEWDVLIRRGGLEQTVFQPEPIVRESKPGREAAERRMHELVADLQTGRLRLEH